MNRKDLLSGTVFLAIVLLVWFSWIASAHGQPSGCPAGMTGYWMLNETTGGTFDDYYNGNDATCVSCPTSGAGIVSNGQYFDGVNDRIDVPDDGSFDWSASSSFTIEFWMRSGGCLCTEVSWNCNQVMAGRSSAVTPWWIGFNCGTGSGPVNTLRCYFDVGIDMFSSMTLNDNVWHHIVFAYDQAAGQYLLYIDGALDNSLAAAGKDRSGAGPIGLGYYSADFQYSGALDEFAVYNQALPLSEIQNHYNAGAGQTYCVMNLPPVVADIPDQTIAEGGSFATIALDDFVTDPDHTDAEILWTYAGNTDLSVSIDGNRVATITIPNSEWSGSESITFTATDPGSLFDADAASFTVTAVNDPPIVTDIPDQSILEGESFATIALDDYVSDADHSDAQLYWTYAGTTDLTVSIDGSHIATITVPSPSWTGSETITFTATDPDLATGSDAAAFTVTGVNDPPEVADIPNQVVTAGSPFATITLDDYVSDPDNLDSEIGWSYAGNVDLTVAIVDRVVTITAPTPTWTGAETVTFTATDPGALTDADAATFKVMGTGCLPGMSHYWKYDEMTGGYYADSYGSNPGACTNCPTSILGVAGNALQFDGVNDRVDVPDDDSFDWPATASFTVEFWARPVGCGCTSPTFTCNQVIVGRSPTVSGGWWIGMNCGFDAGDVNRLRCYFGGTTDLLSTTPFDDGQWHHVACVFDQAVGNYLLYVDGALEKTLAAPGQDLSGSVPLGIGYYSNGYQYDGDLDELALYDVALDAATIAEHFDNGAFGIGYCTLGNSAPQITSAPVTTGMVGTPYDYDVNATGFPTPTYALSVYPSGMVIDNTNGLITWSPTTSGNFNVEVVASNTEGSDIQPFIIAVEPASACSPEMTHYWKLDETAGSAYADFVGEADATCVNCPTPVSGIVGGAQLFDRVDDQVVVPDDDSYDWDAADSYTIEFWMKADCGCTSSDYTCNEVILSRFDITNPWWIGLSCRTSENPGKLRCYFGVDTDLYSTVDVNDEVWHHVVYIRDNALGESRLYVDGLLNASVTVAAPVRAGVNKPMQVGWANGSPYYRYGGVLDELAIYDGILGEGRIKQHYRNGLGTTYCYLCGDADGSTGVNISDAVFLINYIFMGGPLPSPELAGDVDCSTQITISDVVYLISYIFVGGPEPCAACK